MCKDCLLDARYNLVYKEIFEKEDILIAFLNEVLKNYYIVQVKVIDTDTTEFSSDDRANLIPILAKTSKDENVNIELYKLDKYDVYEREKSFICKRNFKEIETSKQIKPKLEDTKIVIVIASCELEFIENENYHNIYNFGDKTLHYLELPKVKLDDVSCELEFFLQFINKKLDVLANKQSYQIDGLFEAILLLFELSNDPNAGETARYCQKSSLDRVSYLESAIKKAEHNAKLQLAITFLDSYDDETTAQKTDLEVYEVKKLRTTQLKEIIQADLNSKVKEIKEKGLVYAKKAGHTGKSAQQYARNFVKGFYGEQIRVLIRVLHEIDDMSEEKICEVVNTIEDNKTLINALKQNPNYVLDIDDFDIE